jgi:glycosyltransferase involved in cell wall biosynthesis
VVQSLNLFVADPHIPSTSKSLERDYAFRISARMYEFFDGRKPSIIEALQANSLLASMVMAVITGRKALIRILKGSRDDPCSGSVDRATMSHAIAPTWCRCEKVLPGRSVSPAGAVVKHQPLLCWIVVNSMPYHEARLNAAAEQARLRVCMVQLTDIDTHWTVQKPEQIARSIQRRTLFANKPWREIDGRAMVRRLNALLDELRPDVVCINGWSFGGCIAALSWCGAHRVPAVLMSESTALDHPRHHWKEAIKRRIVRLCSASLVGGTPHRDYIAALGASLDHVFTGYDAVDNEHFRIGASRAQRAEQSLRQKLGLPPRFFMACSRLVAKKNLARLLEAYGKYREAAGEAPWSLVIVGDGELMGEFLALRSRLRLEAHVQFPGSKSYEELPSYYGLANAFIHASTTEEWGLVVNEAMAAGLPVLVSERCGCASDLVVPGINGLLFDPEDVTSIAQAMLEIGGGSHDHRAMGRSSQEIVARWSPARFAESLNGAVEASLRTPAPSAGLIDRLMLWTLRER